MKVRTWLIPVFCTLAASSAAPPRAAGRMATIEARLEAAAPGGARGTATLQTEDGAGTRFSIKTTGLTPGACEVRVAGKAVALLFVEDSGTGELLFDTALFDKTIGSGAYQETDVSPLSFDPRGKTLQISRDGQNLLEVNFPVRPMAGRR